jgi:hypothetical protein
MAGSGEQNNIGKYDPPWAGIHNNVVTHKTAPPSTHPDTISLRELAATGSSQEEIGNHGTGQRSQERISHLCIP